MTEKRFKEIYPDIIRSNYCFTDNEEPIGDKEVCDLLNALHEENERLTDKLNNTALELVDCVISMGKAVEISEMNYQEFLEYRAEHNKPMELRE